MPFWNKAVEAGAWNGHLEGKPAGGMGRIPHRVGYFSHFSAVTGTLIALISTKEMPHPGHRLSTKGPPIHSPLACDSCYTTNQAMAKFEDLWRSERTLEAVLDNISDGVLTYDHDLRITGVNRAAVEILGYPAEDIVGHDCREVFRCEACDPGCGFAVALANMRPVSNSTVRIHTVEGMERLALIHTTPVQDREGNLEGVVVTFQDVTEQVMALEALRAFLGIVNAFCVGELLGLVRGEQLVCLRVLCPFPDGELLPFGFRLVAVLALADADVLGIVRRRPAGAGARPSRGALTPCASRPTSAPASG